MAYLIDTNVIIRLFTQDNEEMYREAFAFFEKVANFEIEAIISEGVVLESWFVLKNLYKMPKDEFVERFLSILTLSNVINQDKQVLIEALKILQRRNIDFIDALLCARAAVQGHKVYSFDTDIQKCLKESDAV